MGFRVFQKLKVPCLGIPMRRVRVFLGSIWGPPILRNYHMESQTQGSGFQIQDQSFGV